MSTEMPPTLRDGEITICLRFGVALFVLTQVPTRCGSALGGVADARAPGAAAPAPIAATVRASAAIRRRPVMREIAGCDPIIGEPPTRFSGSSVSRNEAGANQRGSRRQVTWITLGVKRAGSTA